MLTVRAAAKVNLTLDVLARRADGYHELASVVHTVGLWDSLTFEFGGPARLSLECTDVGLGGEDNLCLKAARAWIGATGRDDVGVHIALEKHIPCGAGLGGGSSDAAATLVALNRHFGGPLDTATLYRLAVTLGADVPLFLHGGCVLMEGIGERLTPLPALNGWIVLVKPAASLGTPDVYRAWDALGRASARATGAMCDAVQTGSVEAVAKALQNDLFVAAQHLTVADMVTWRNCLRRAGALGATMTGSGTTVFGLLEDEATATAVASRLRHDETLRADGIAVWAVPLVPRGMEFPGTDMVSVQ